MKRIAAIVLVLFLALFTFTACTKEAGAPKAGTAKATDLLGMIPADVQGVFFMDVNKAMSTEFANKMIQENEDYQKYQEFVEKSGLDPQKDIYYLAVGVMGELQGEDSEGVGVINMKYDPDTILDLIKEKVAEEENSLVNQQKGLKVYEKTLKLERLKLNKIIKEKNLEAEIKRLEE